MRGLEAVLAEHHPTGWGPITHSWRCACGEECPTVALDLHAQQRTERESFYAAHLAAVVSAHLAEWLRGDVMHAHAEQAIRDAADPDVPDWWWHTAATAALDAVADEMRSEEQA